ncbi:MAG: hypothetical protein ACM37Z_11950 [Deltaproteobacteria bacterium]
MKPLGRNRKGLALLVIAIGIYTFFATMVVVEPPILNLTKWSALDITLNVYDGTLPVPGGSLDEGLLEIALIYVLMILALAALCVPGPPRALLVISTIGFALSSLAKFWDSTFHRAFGYYGHMQQWHMSRGPAWWILPWIMPVLVAICFAKTLDEPDAESRGD